MSGVNIYNQDADIRNAVVTDITVNELNMCKLVIFVVNSYN